MKTKNNVQKTTLNTLAAATGLVILSFTVHAQGTSKSLFANIETNHIAMVTGKTFNISFASAVNTKSLTKAESFAAYLVTETEEPLHLEEWMLNENNFSTFQIKDETEKPLELQEWMTDESNFDANLFNFEVETEKELNLERWMLNENMFEVNESKTEPVKTKEGNKTISTATFVYTEVNEERALKVEDWMINPKVWGR